MNRFFFTLLLISLNCYSQEIRIGYWNLNNYLTQHRWIEGKFTAYYPKPEAEKAEIRNAVKLAQLDMIFFQEIGSKGHLKELQLDLKSEGENFPYLICSKGNGEKRILGILSKTPINIFIEHSNWEIELLSEQIPFRRSPIEWGIEKENKHFRFLGIHLKSRYTNHSSDPEGFLQRKAESKKIANYLEANSEVKILIGDFNHEVSDSSLQPLVEYLRENGFRQIVGKDRRGESWTYEYWKTKERSLVDQAWVKSPLHARSEILMNEKRASDHRLVVLIINTAEDCKTINED